MSEIEQQAREYADRVAPPRPPEAARRKVGFSFIAVGFVLGFASSFLHTSPLTNTIVFGLLLGTVLVTFVVWYRVHRQNNGRVYARRLAELGGSSGADRT